MNWFKELQKYDREINDLVEVCDERLGKDDSYLLDSSAIRKQLNWTDAIDLDEGIDDTIKWVENNLSELRDLPWDYQQDMKILVTGGCGYKGSKLIPQLLADGHKVTSLDTKWFGDFLPSHSKSSEFNRRYQGYRRRSACWS